MITEQDIVAHCGGIDYDIRKSGNGRWIDQKCTPDVLCVVADCVVQFVQANGVDTVFSSGDIWHSEYADENVRLIFNKPDLTQKKARREYDKFFAHPLKLLAYSQILNETKVGRTNQYAVNRADLLEYIALRERNALTFLNIYIWDVLSDSGMADHFENFFAHGSKEKFFAMKSAFEDFTLRYTPINGVVETRRIFTKVLNPLAFIRKKHGTDRGRMSKDIISMDMLMYNRLNFRDIYADKPRNITRKAYAATHPIEINEAFYHYQSAKARRYLKLWNDQYRDGDSEYREGIAPEDKATNIHHIFPEGQYPEISFFLENLIALTPTQHYNNAHPDFRTQEINAQYQHTLLLAKAGIIEWNINTPDVETIYELDKFVYVLSVGFDDDLTDRAWDFPNIVLQINLHFLKE